MQATLTAPDDWPSVVIIGAGFGGLRVARGLRGAPLDVTILDQRNYHTFIPLLYQVATAGLEPEEIAQPIRHILRGASNIKFRLGCVTGIDTERRVVITGTGDLRYRWRRPRTRQTMIRAFERFAPQQHIGVTMKTFMKNLDDWTADELLAEVLDRSAGDRPALDRIQATTMRAVLNDCDEKADAGRQPSHWARRSSVDRSR